MSDQGFRDAFDAALSEFGEPESGGEVATEEALEEQAAPEADAVDDDDVEEPQAVDEEPELEGEEQEEQPAISWRDVPPDTWSDIDRARLEELPEPLRKWKIERDRLAGKLGETERRYQELQARVPKEKPTESAEPSSPPPLPPSDADDATYQKMMDAREQWFSEQGALKAVAILEERQRQQEQRRQIEQQQQQYQQWADQQVGRIQQKEGFSEEVADLMAALASDQSRPWYGAMLQSESGVDQLFNEARSIVEGKRVAVQQTTKRSTARNRVTPRPKPAPKQTAADIEIPDAPDNVGGKVGAIMDAFGG
jgi:flavodoxin